MTLAESAAYLVGVRAAFAAYAAADAAAVDAWGANCTARAAAEAAAEAVCAVDAMQELT